MIFESIENIVKEFSTTSSFLLICLVVALCLICIYQKLLKNKNRYKESIETFVSAFFLILLTYSPIIKSYYVFHDDYYLWVWQKGVCYTHPQYLFLLSIGRPIANIFLCPLISMIDRLESANLARLICIILTSIVFLIINKFLIYLKFNKLFSYSIALIIVTSFSFQVYNAWIMASYMLIGIIFSMFSIFLAVKLIEAIKKKEKYLLNQGAIKIKKLFYNVRFSSFYILSIILYILTLATYQPSAGFFTCFAAIYILKDKEIRVTYLRLIGIVVGSIFFISNFLYFSILRALLLLFSYDDFISSYDPRILKFVFDPSFIIDRLIWFFKVPFLNSVNILNIESKFLSAIFLIVLGVSFIILYLEDIKYISVFKNKILLVVYKYLIVAIFIPLSYISVLVSNNSEINYRTIAPLSVFCFVTILIGLETFFIRILSNSKISRYFKNLSSKILLFYFLSFFCMFNLLSANFYLQTFVRNHSLEIRYLKGQINSVPIEHIRRIMIVTPIDSSIIANSIHDLNYLSSSYPGNINQMLTAAFTEISALKQLEQIKIVVSHHGNKNIIQEGNRQDFKEIQLVQEGYKGFNIIKVDAFFYAILQGEGEFSIERIQSKDYSIFFVAEKQPNILEKIDQYLEANDRFKIILGDESYREFNDIKRKKQLRNEELVIDMNKIRLF